MKATAGTPLWIFGALLLILLQVYAQSTIQCPEPEPGSPPVLLPNPKNCSQYYICDGRNPILMECPAPTSFDPNQNACLIYPCIATTDPPTAPPTTTQPMTSTTPPTETPSEVPTTLQPPTDTPSEVPTTPQPPTDTPSEIPVTDPQTTEPEPMTSSNPKI